MTTADGFTPERMPTEPTKWWPTGDGHAMVLADGDTCDPGPPACPACLRTRLVALMREGVIPKDGATGS